MWILIQSPEQHALAEAAIAAVPSLLRRELQLLPVCGEVHQATAALRARVGADPIGLLALDEPSVIDALQGGADEAAVLDTPAPASMVAFVDRVQVRAALRAEGHRLQAAYDQTEKLAALGTLVAGVGHEINNPLSAVMLSATVIQRHLLPVFDTACELLDQTAAGNTVDPELTRRLRKLQPTRARSEVRSLLHDMATTMGTIASIVRDLRAVANPNQGDAAEVVDVPELLDQVLRLLQRDISSHGIVTRDYAPGLPQLLLPRNRLIQVLTNLLVNAAQAIAEVERESHRIEVNVRADEEFLAIAIRDTGPGIAPEAVTRVFDPFYTTKRGGRGTGLGLSISRGIVRGLGGDLTVESVAGAGATFLCFLPIPAGDALRRAQTAGGAPVGASVSPTARSVLVVEADTPLSRAYVRLLSPEHRVTVAHDGTEAQELLASGTAPDVVVLEIDLPGGEGEQLLHWLREQRPSLVPRTIIATTPDGEARHHQAIAAHTGPLLHKPLRGDTLLSTVSTVSAQHREEPAS